MKVLTTYEFHYLQYEDGFYDPRNYTVGDYYQELFDVFDKVVLVGRCKKTNKKPDCQRVDNDRIEFFPVTDFKGNTGFIGQLRAFWRCRKVVGLADRYWLRAPGFMASMVGFWLKRAKIPFYMHTVGDPVGIAETKTNWLPESIAKWIIHFVRYRFQRLMRFSSGSLAVTEATLQKQYPSSIPENDFGASDVRLEDRIFKETKRTFSDEIFNIVIVAVLVDYKGHRYLLEALSKIKDKRRNWRLFAIGQGPLREKLGISDRVEGYWCCPGSTTACRLSGDSIKRQKYMVKKEAAAFVLRYSGIPLFIFSLEMSMQDINAVSCYITPQAAVSMLS